MAADRLGVVGYPVAHSLSPRIQNAGLEALGLDGWRYQLVPVPPELLEETVHGLPGAGFRGVSVTVPHKEAALAIA
ncbi:MAG: shikimate dehydrogenase, partial [Solirubrobacterales bacterium]